MTSLAEQPSELEVLQAARERWMRDVHTFMPGIVKSYSTTPVPTATVELAVELDKPDGSRYAMPALLSVPVCWPRGGGFAFTAPMTSGDSVLVLFSEEDPGQWYTTGQVSPPEIERRHGLYAFAIPAAFNLTQVLLPHQVDGSAAVVSHTNGGALQVTDTVSVAALDFVALATIVNTQLEEIRNLLKTWVPVPNDGGAALKTAAATLWAAPSTTTAAETVKAV